MTNALATTISRILRQPGMAKMGFQIGDLVVTGTRYSDVARAVEGGQISCKVVTQFEAQGELATGMTVEARYSADADSMMFLSESYGVGSHGEERTIVHEATHAIFDLYAKSKNDKRLAIDDEAAAVLAEAFYIRFCNKPVGGFAMFIEGPQREALRLVDEIGVETNNFTEMPVLYRFKPQQTETLRAAVARDWNFVKVKEKRGWTDNSTARYVYNGVPKCGKDWRSEK